jgi:DNA-directed RNA polymerase specialized sigma24 family protein
MSPRALLDLNDIPSITVAPAGKALAAKLVTETELLRLKAIAHLQARGLPPAFTWSDLLQEAFTRILDGSRRRPKGISMVSFVAGIMRSIKSEYWRKSRLELDSNAEVQHMREDAPDPERSLAALQELTALSELFADDAQVQQIIAGAAEQRSAEEIRATGGMSKVEYDSARRRMRRTLLREGLRWRVP